MVKIPVWMAGLALCGLALLFLLALVQYFNRMWEEGRTRPTESQREKSVSPIPPSLPEFLFKCALEILQSLIWLLFF